MEQYVHQEFAYIVRGQSVISGEYRSWDAWSRGIARIKESSIPVDQRAFAEFLA